MNDSIQIDYKDYSSILIKQLQEINSFQPQQFFNNQNFSQGINSQITHENFNSSVQQTKQSNHDKSQPSYDKLNSQCKLIKAIGFNQNISNQGIISQCSISHKNDQLSFQQSKKINHDKNQEFHDKFNSQDMIIKVSNIESLDNLKQCQINNLQPQLQFTNQNITNQGISSQSQISHKNECDFYLREINEVDVKNTNLLDQLQIYHICLPKQNNKYYDKFYLNKEQIQEKLCEKSCELDRCIKIGGEALIFENKNKKYYYQNCFQPNN
ncbi:hypothetical protein ABPG72_017690 [Tetrahymena utriculariae]